MDDSKKLSINEMNSAAYFKLAEDGVKMATLDKQAFVRDQVFNMKKNNITYQGKVANNCYLCKDCNDKFALASSLDYHINRCSVNITLNCTFCAKTLKFTNKCKMMIHIRSHPQMNTINIKDIKAEPLSISKLKYKKVNLSLDENSVPDFIPEGYAVSGYKPLNISTENPTIITAVSKLNLIFENAFKALNNYESPFHVNTTISDIANIFSSNHSSVIEDTINDDSTKLLPVSTDLSNLPCVDNTNKSLNKVKVSTISNSVPEIIVDTPSCPICLFTFNVLKSSRGTRDFNKLRQNHFTSVSEGKSFQCLHCDLALPNVCSLKAHMLLHNPTTVLFVCPECGVSFKSTEELTFHLSRTCYHFLRCMAVCCFKKNCGMIRTEKLQRHLIDCHYNPTFKCPHCCLESETSEILKYKLDQAHDKGPASYKNNKMFHKCKSCFKMIPQEIIRDIMNTDLLMEQTMAAASILSFVCVGCSKIFLKLPETRMHIFQCPFFNSAYNNMPKKFVAAPENRPSSHTINKNNMIIPHSSSSSIEILENNEITTKVIDQIKDVMNIELFCDKSTQNKGQNKRPATSYDEDDKSLPKRRNSRRKSKNSNSPISAEKNLMECVEMYEKNTCRKCSFTSDYNDVFRDHLLTHRHTATAYQCMECGECFVAESSLCTHLTMFHKVTKPEDYIKSHNCYDKEAILKQKEDKLLFRGNKKAASVMENQCQICFEQFDNNIDHDKHFRVHGMAFLLKKTKMQVI